MRSLQIRTVAYLPFLLLSFLSSNLQAKPTMIPRAPTRNFVQEGLFEGGGSGKNEFIGLRVAEHPEGGFERWVFDFSEKTAPKFQVQYQKSSRVGMPDGSNYERKPAKFIFFFRSLTKSALTQNEATKLAKKSKYVKEVLLYPPVEGGDMAVEFVLKDDVRFEPHQPIEKASRLVLDLKKNSSEEID